jgi:WhiB family redox-sensing transcriptional regulator
MTARPWHQILHPSAVLGDWATNPQRACAGADPEAWFPETGASNRAAKQLCASCVVQVECRGYAIRAEPHVYGIWGGTTEGQRMRLRRERRAAA